MLQGRLFNMFLKRLKFDLRL